MHKKIHTNAVKTYFFKLFTEKKQKVLSLWQHLLLDRICDITVL